MNSSVKEPQTMVQFYREKKKLSQYELARLSGVSRSAIILIEMGKSSPTMSTLQKLSAALGVAVQDLLK